MAGAFKASPQRLMRPPGLKAGSWHLRCGTLASLLGIRGGPAELKGQPPRSSGALKKTKLARLRSLWAGRWPAVTSTREGGNAADRERIETHLDGWGLQGFSATTHEAARPEGRVLAPAVRDTGFTVGNTRRPCRIERPATAIIGGLKKKQSWLAYARYGLAVGQPSLPLGKAGTRQIGRESRHILMAGAFKASPQRLVRSPGLKAGSWHLRCGHLRCGTLASLLGIRGGPAELKGQPPRSSVP